MRKFPAGQLNREVYKSPSEIRTLAYQETWAVKKAVEKVISLDNDVYTYPCTVC